MPLPPAAVAVAAAGGAHTHTVPTYSCVTAHNCTTAVTPAPPHADGRRPQGTRGTPATGAAMADRTVYTAVLAELAELSNVVLNSIALSDYWGDCPTCLKIDVE